jgi:hypothetical protein
MSMPVEKYRQDLDKLDKGVDSLAMQCEAKRKSDALAASYAASRRGVIPEPIPESAPTLKIPDPITLLSDAELASRASVSERLPAGDLTGDDYRRQSEGRAARSELVRRAIDPKSAVRVR